MVYLCGKAGETGKLYGSITTEMIADQIFEKTGIKIERRQIDSQPIRNLGDHKARVRLTVDLMPEVKILVYREGEAPTGQSNPQKSNRQRSNRQRSNRLRSDPGRLHHKDDLLNRPESIQYAGGLVLFNMSLASLMLTRAFTARQR